MSSWTSITRRENQLQKQTEAKTKLFNQVLNQTSSASGRPMEENRSLWKRICPDKRKNKKNFLRKYITGSGSNELSDLLMLLISTTKQLSQLSFAKQLKTNKNQHSHINKHTHTMLLSLRRRIMKTKQSMIKKEFLNSSRSAQWAGLCFRRTDRKSVV